MDLEELELALEKLDLEILEEKNEITLMLNDFNQNEVLIINNKCENNDKFVKEWSID